MARVMTEEGIRSDQLADGQRIRWTNSFGVTCSARIERIESITEGFYGEAVSFYDERIAPNGREPIHSNLRSVALTHITHVNGQRVKKSEKGSRQSPGGRVELNEPEDVAQDDILEPSPREGVMAEAAGMKTRKSLDEMSESHRKHVEQWGPHAAKLKAEFVWIAVSRFPQRGTEGKFYVAVKRGDKDFAIVDYDTTKVNTKSYRPKVVEDGFETSTAMMKAFKVWRQTAREERAAARPKPKPATKSAKKPAAKKAPAKAKAKPKAKATAKRTKAPARSKAKAS